MSTARRATSSGRSPGRCVEKLTRFKRIEFSIKDIHHFVKGEIISQDTVEMLLLQNEISYDTVDIIAIAERNYI